MKIRAVLICAAIAAFVSSVPLYEAGAKDKEIEVDVSGAAKDVKSAAKEVGRKIKSTAKDKKLRKSLKAVGKETKEALKETGRAIKKEVPVEVEKKK